MKTFCRPSAKPSKERKSYVDKKWSGARDCEKRAEDNKDYNHGGRDPKRRSENSLGAEEHEIDHLNGVLIVDRISRLKRDIYRNKLKKENGREKRIDRASMADHFFGTPSFAVPTLKGLLQGPEEVIAVVTQPDREKGRGRKLISSPVKELIVPLGIPVLQPEKVKEETFQEHVKEFHPDLFVVVDFFITPSAELADYILPAATWLERDDLCHTHWKPLASERGTCLSGYHELDLIVDSFKEGNYIGVEFWIASHRGFEDEINIE
jgi:hypothetical protein